MTGGKKKWTSLLLLSSSSALLTCVLVEVGLALFHPVHFRRPPSGNLKLRLFHRPSAIPGLSYEMEPNREIVRRGIQIRTNQYGMRDTEPSTETTDSPCRIAVIGDSYTFGLGVAAELAYPKVLEKRLRNSPAAKNCPFEVLNFGVNGYSSYDEALLLRYRVVNFDPRVLIVGYVLNDPEIDPIQPLHAYYAKLEWWQYSNILRMIAGVKYRWEVNQLGGGDYYKYLHAPGRRKWQSVVDAFSDIRQVTAPRNIRVIVAILPELELEFKGRPWSEYPFRALHKQVSELAIQNGFRVVDILDAFSEHPSQDVVFPGIDDHPTPLGHELAAQALEKELLAEYTYFFGGKPPEPASATH